MNRTVQFIIGVIAVVVALGAGFYGRNLYLKEVSTYQVPVPINAIPAYAILDADMFQMREMPRTMASLPYYQSTQDLEGKISTVSLPAELPVAQANAVPVSQFRLADAAYEVLSIPVEPVSAVGGQIRIGEHVNLYQVLPEEIDPENTAISANDQSTFKVELIARSVLVVDVRNAQGVAAESNQKSEDNSTFGGSPQNEQVQILTLAVEPKDVDVILTAVAASKKQGGLLWSTPGTSLIHPTAPPTLQPLNQSDLLLIERVREELVQRGINPPSWREADSEKRRRFYDEVRSILIDQGENRSSVNRNAQIITDALSGVGLLDQLLRDPYVEEIFVRNGEVAVEYDGSFYHLGKLADDSYFENLAVHVADQGGATLRGDRPAVLIDLPGGERFTAIVPRLSTEGTAINIRTFGRRVRTLEEMEQTGTFAKCDPTKIGLLQTFTSPAEKDTRSELTYRIQSLKDTPDRFLAWMVANLAGSLMIAGEMGSGKTTLLNALSGFLPVSAPIAALETFRELEIQHPFLLRTVAPAELSPGTPGVTLDWVLNVIYTRMNPAAILVGEVVGNEALQFLKATCLGRKALTTIHGGTIEESLMRLEQLALAAAPELGLAAVRSMVAMGLDVIALMGRVNRSGRVQRTLQAIATIKGINAKGDYCLNYLYRAEGDESLPVFEQAYHQLEGMK